jgi:hypothetical protein
VLCVTKKKILTLVLSADSVHIGQLGVELGTDHLTCRGGGYGFLFRSEFLFRTTQELEYLFFLSREAQFFFPGFNIRLYDKTLNQIFFSSTKIRIFFSAVKHHKP